MTSPPTRPVALVTGASGGIGLELAKLAAADGHDLVLVARSADKLAGLGEELIAEHGIAVRQIVADLAAPGGVAGVLEELGGTRIDVLVNNAGVGGQGRFGVERDLADDLAMIQLNITSLVELTGHLLPPMIERGSGAVLNLASTAGFTPGPLMAVYYASKAFVRSFSEALTEECRGTGVRVTALCPGPVDTSFAAASGLQGTLLMRSSPAKVSAADVAAEGWAGLQKGRAVVIPGLFVKFAVHGLRFTPRRVAARLAERSQTT
ncbi:MAG TPA: SDR family oxidoreductase [Frankiaceae bacterium]|nr:SDR family oxidoreductase [Frankiaceae bacterium]